MVLLNDLAGLQKLNNYYILVLYLDSESYKLLKNAQCESSGERDINGNLLYPQLALEHTQLTKEIEQIIINLQEYQAFKSWWKEEKIFICYKKKFLTNRWYPMAGQTLFWKFLATCFGMKAANTKYFCL
ncbi:hypothetical protein F8M41_020142 [Gigaspora margarita]|uniref:Uncharacterized protein n=1 Tax=Gigaspora margarita TaxID=4874 RepID=A0A8H4AIV5_GIGMA|nr:hypothetical protein F8M41_020142 [Gigaspora margarita]